LTVTLRSGQEGQRTRWQRTPGPALTESSCYFVNLRLTK